MELNQLSVPSMKQSDQQLKHPKHMIVIDDRGLHPTWGWGIENRILKAGPGVNPQHLLVTIVTVKETKRLCIKSCTICWLCAKLALLSWQAVFVDTVPSPRTSTGVLLDRLKLNHSSFSIISSSRRVKQKTLNKSQISLKQACFL